MSIDKVILDKPQEFLEDFYRKRRINMDDLNERYHTLSSLVHIPNFPYESRKPALAELEVQFLKDNGFNYL